MPFNATKKRMPVRIHGRIKIVAIYATQDIHFEKILGKVSKNTFILLISKSSYSRYYNGNSIHYEAA